MQIYSDAMSDLPLPISDAALNHAHVRAGQLAKDHLRHQTFGEAVSDQDFSTRLATAGWLITERNAMRSKELCEKLQIECSDELEATVNQMRLPSRSKFLSGFARNRAAHCLLAAVVMSDGRRHKRGMYPCVTERERERERERYVTFRDTCVAGATERTRSCAWDRRRWPCRIPAPLLQ